MVFTIRAKGPIVALHIYLIDHRYIYFFTGHKNWKRFLKCKTVSSGELLAGKKKEQTFPRKLAKFSETVSHFSFTNVCFPREDQQVKVFMHFPLG